MDLTVNSTYATIFRCYLILFVVVNYVRSEGAEALAEALKMNTTLTELNINNPSDDKYNDGLFGGLNGNDITEPLKMLYDPVARNRINYEFSKNPSLTELGFGHRNMHSGSFGENSNIMIGRESAKVLAERIKTSSSLTSLYLNNE